MTTRGRTPRTFPRYPACGQAETVRLVTLAQDEGTDKDARSTARSAAVEGNYPLALSIAGKYRFEGIEAEDIEQEAVLGLYDAVDRYDPARGTRFSTYATHWIKQGIRRYYQMKGRTVRRPCWTQTRLARAARLRAKGVPRDVALLAAADGRASTARYLAQAMQGTTHGQPVTFEEDGGDDDGRRLWLLVHVLVAAPAADPGETIDREAMAGRIRRALARLDPRDIRILEHRYELDGHAFMTLEGVGELLGITRERVRQLEDQALAKLAALMARQQPRLLSLPLET